ncbi:probable hexosyltransferase MUCI70 isoform X2 [Capsicum annuum]|uniref:probable hexosyltransferase MUCI70 isoform X2 n=1 Tax=Capsicum annuum TaxID=4072 RepID=UPI001FB16FF7|nr:probable hexosyltransferase MUCI70 isoform X2 [Capsicum annuum]XP_047271552.1 probable hexosyltransferase MUCI70 isoform X2 [Capsicum annuum]
MTGWSLGLRTGSDGSLQQLAQNGVYHSQNSFFSRKGSKTSLSGFREKEKWLPSICRFLVRKQVGMLILVVFALLAFVVGFSMVNKDDASRDSKLDFKERFENNTYHVSALLTRKVMVCGENKAQLPPPHALAMIQAKDFTAFPHPCQNFAFPPPPPGDSRRIGPRPCRVCYVPVEQAIARMPRVPSASPGLQHLTYFHEQIPIKTEPHGGSAFGGYPSLVERNMSFDIKESMTVHCGFVKGCRPGDRTGFDINAADLKKMEKYHDIIVASAIFGNYDVIQQPKNSGKIAQENVPFYMFVDEETEASLKNSSLLDSRNRVGLWRIILVRNVPYSDARRNGKVPKLLLHRLFPNVRYSIWIDGKLQLVVDPYQILERFLWRQNATFAISRHYRRFDVFEEAEANKAAGKYDNVSIDHQIDFYKKEDVPEGCVIMKEHIPITNLFTCLWFNEVDRFTSRDQLSFSTVRDKLMAKVSWNVNMFLDCERRNFVIQAYHRDLLEQRAHMTVLRSHPPPALVRDKSVRDSSTSKSPVRRPPKHGKGERKSNSRRHRRAGSGNRGSSTTI